MKKALNLLFVIIGLVALCACTENDKISDKIIIEDNGVIISEEVGTETEKLLNDYNNQFPSIMIVLKCDYDAQKDLESLSGKTVEEVQEELKDARNSNKEYFLTFNNEIYEKYNFDKQDQKYSIDSYAPYIYADFNRELNDNDIKFFNKISKSDDIINVYINYNEMNID